MAGVVAGMETMSHTSTTGAGGPTGRLGLVVLLLAATFAAVLLVRNTAPVVRAAIRTELPDRVGEWTGEAVYFCQNEQCLRSYAASELEGTNTCPACGGALKTVSLAERQLLPADTGIAKKLYANPRGARVFATVVLSGLEQRSIHRPQQCLPGQGYAIEKSRVVDVPLAGRRPLRVMVLDLRRPGSGQADAGALKYAYWFVGPGRETPYHLQRLWWTSVDLLAHNLAPRWAYVALSADVGTTEGQEERIREFIRDLHPLLVH